MEMFLGATTGDITFCRYCKKNVWQPELFDREKYYLFTDMSDAKKSVFCEQCFMENSPT
jgi:hypothetical protein